MVGVHNVGHRVQRLHHSGYFGALLLVHQVNLVHHHHVGKFNLLHQECGQTAVIVFTGGLAALG